MNYHFKVEKEGSKFWAQCIELEGCVTQGSSMKELKFNMHQALNLYIQEPFDSKDLAQFPRKNVRKKENICEIKVDSQIAFAFLVRYHRIKSGLTQSQAAKKIGFPNVNSYQRLESRRCNPTLKMMEKVKEVFPGFSADLTLC